MSAPPVQPGSLAGRRVLVLGLGRSGVAAARLALELGARVSAADRKTARELSPEAAALADAGVRLCLGSDAPGALEGAEVLVVSPGVPSDAPMVAEARRRGIPVWGEVELAARQLRGEVVAVTGSNGKSTVTALVGRMLRASGIPGGTGGNLGTPLSALLAEDAGDAVHAVELSSFQLETVESLRPRVSALLNLSPDHLDRHGSLEAYTEAKARLLALTPPGAFAVLNRDDASAWSLRERTEAAVHAFSLEETPSPGAFVRDGRLVLRTASFGEEPVLPVEALALPGRHNLANALAASLAARLAGASVEAVAGVLRTFGGLPHRMESVGVARGVRCVNDSKATNVESARLALESYPPASVHLILGGRDKGGSWASLAGSVARHARAVYLIGEAAARIAPHLPASVPVHHCGDLERAVGHALREARPGETLLLSPGCASFDQYPDFEARGEHFRTLVRRLAEEA